MYEKEKPKPPQISREELYKRVTYKYLGFGNKKKLEAIEKEAEEKERVAANTEMADKYASKKRQKTSESETSGLIDIQSFRQMNDPLQVPRQ